MFVNEGEIFSKFIRTYIPLLEAELSTLSSLIRIPYVATSYGIVILRGTVDLTIALLVYPKQQYTYGRLQAL